MHKDEREIRRLVSTWMIMLCALIAGCASSATKTTDISEPIQRSEYVTVDGAKLFLLTRGADRRAPVLLWLHGGPGGPERPLFRYFNDELENYYVVAYWDQRGAGRSFDPDVDPHRLTIPRHLTDLDAIVDHLRQTFGRDKVVLIGHSWGSALGLLYARQHPDKVSAFIGVAQLVSLLRAQQAQYDFVSTEAASRKDEAALARLRKIGQPPHRTDDPQIAMEELANQYGGVSRRQPCKPCVVIQGIFAGLVTPWELMAIHRGIQVSLNAMTPELLGLDLERSVPSVDVPVFFFLGRYDRHLDAKIAADYFKTLQAPFKQLVWFENSGHGVPFEESKLFNKTVLDSLQSLGIQGRNP